MVYKWMPWSSYVTLYQLNFSHRVPGLPLKPGFWQPSWITSTEAEAVKTLLNQKDIFQAIYISNMVSVTMYMNVISYILICSVYCEVQVPSVLAPPQLLWMMKQGSIPIMKTWYKITYYTLGGLSMKLSVYMCSLWFSESKYSLPFKFFLKLHLFSC